MTRKIDNALWDFDKGKDITPEGPLFDMTCGNCSSEKISIKPIGVFWKTCNDNSDLPPGWERFYNSLPTLNEAIIQAIHLQHGILVSCQKCKQTHKIAEHIERTRIVRWLNGGKNSEF